MKDLSELPVAKSHEPKLFSPAFKTAGTVGSVGGFIGDVLTPLGKIIEGLLLIAITITIVSFIFSFIKKDKSELFKKVSLNSSFFSAVFGIFLLLNQGTNAGFLGDNFEPIAKLQQSINLISDQLTEIDSKIEKGFADVSEIKDIISGDAELKNMSSTNDLTATKELNERTKGYGAKRVAILYFDNTGENVSMNQLKKGLADMLITDLSNVQMLDIVERDRMESLLAEQNLNNSKDFDPETAARLGKLLGADIILTGGYFDLFGSIRIDARFIDVETGQILKSDGVDGETSNFFKIQKQLSWKIINNMDTKLTEDEVKKLENQQTSQFVSIDDLNRYSQALFFYDEGRKRESKKIVESLLITYPEFEPAKRLLDKLNGEL